MVSALVGGVYSKLEAGDLEEARDSALKANNRNAGTLWNTLYQNRAIEALLID
jgi:hypothetical protein